MIEYFYLHDYMDFPYCDHVDIDHYRDSPDDPVDINNNTDFFDDPNDINHHTSVAKPAIEEDSFDDPTDINHHTSVTRLITEEHTDSEEERSYKCQLVRTEDGDLDICWLHNVMYGLGERYNIPGLKDCSLEKFRRTCEANPERILSIEIIRQVYEGTVETDRALRDLLVDIICRNSNKMSTGPDVLNALQASHSFAMDIALTFFKNKRTLIAAER